MTPEELENRREETLESIMRYIKGSLDLCRTQGDINMVSLYYGIGGGMFLKYLDEKEEEAMKTIEYRNLVDKSKWDRGPWDQEPDKLQWQDAKTGLPCLAVRGPVGSWCGYVGVAPGHKFHGVGYSTCPVGHEDYCDHPPDANLEVHGGITYADRCQKEERERGVCHIPEPGEPDNIWWFGFDCAHWNDYTPGIVASLRSIGSKYQQGGTYKDLNYIKAQCASLAGQLAKISPREFPGDAVSRKFRSEP